MPEPTPTSAHAQKDIDDFRRDCEAILAQVRSVIVGQRAVIDQVLACLLGGGHVLLEGVPGLGKTLLVRTLAETLDLSFSRIQFTPDLMPADITGTNIVVQDQQGDRIEKTFRFQGGPIFASLVLADEINRATPKTQSAVLEAMQEQTVTVARTTHPLPAPFMVLATQNPLEMEGTYPLPEAQLDRFMFKVLVGSPAVDELVSILDRTTGGSLPRARKTVDARLINATHPDSALAPPEVKKYVRYGSSPRGAQAIILAAKVAALRDGRANVAFDDVVAAAAPALRHRLILSFEGQADGLAADEIVAKVIGALPRQEA
jgi:MoxR-like ATPase